MEKCKCLRCGHEWFKRVETRSVLCPGCKNPKWDEKKKLKKANA